MMTNEPMLRVPRSADGFRVGRGIGGQDARGRIPLAGEASPPCLGVAARGAVATVAVMTGSVRVRRWPAYALAVLFLGYAVGKAGYAMQARLGFPSGPPVSAAEAADYFLDPSTAQWLATLSGVLGACLALATVTPLGRRVPRRVMLLLLAAMLLAVGGGAGIMIVDGFVGIGVGWHWYHGVLGVVVIGLLAEMIRSYAVAPRHAAR